MSFKITEDQISDCVYFVAKQLDNTPCDHTHRQTKSWAQNASIVWEDFEELLEEHGGYCDCEVAFNLPMDEDLTLSDAQKA